MKLSALLDEIAGLLNDNEEGHVYTTWREKDVRLWINQAMNIVFDKRPDIFLETKILHVAPCSERQTTCNCEAIRRVIGQSTKDGRIIKGLRKTSIEVEMQWTAPSCSYQKAGDKFRLSSYAIDSVGSTLYVFPPVPPKTDVYVVVECAVRPDLNKLIEDAPDGDPVIDGNWEAPVVQWVLFMAKSIDEEQSSLIMQAAALHKTTFYELLALEAATDALIETKTTTKASS